MNSLEAFLSPAPLEETRDVAIGARFCGKDGKPAVFRVRALSQEENEAIQNECTRFITEGRRRERYFDHAAYLNRLAVEGTVFPDFRNEELLKAHGALAPADLPKKMLRAGEFTALIDAIEALGEGGSLQELANEAKN